MGKKILIRSTTKKKRTDLGDTKPESVNNGVAATDAERKITAKAVNHANQPETDLSKKATAVKSEDKLTTAETDTSAPAKTECLPETVETENHAPLANQKEARQPIETGAIEADVNANGAEKMMDNIKKNAATTDTSKATAENISESTLMMNSEAIDERNGPPQPVSDRSESSKVVINYGSEVEMETSTEVKKGIIISVAALLFIYALIISASVENTRKYYVETTSTAVEVWQGRFAPLGVGDEPLIAIQGAQPPSLVKDIYTRAEIFNYIFNYYLKATDAVIEQPGILDVKKVDTLLNLALQYADNDLNRKAAISRLNGLNQLFLLYKADIAMSKGTAHDLQTAVEYLKKAMPLVTDKNQEERIQRQLETVQRLIAELEQPRASVTENEKKPADEAKPADQSPEKAEKDQAPVKSDTVEEKKASADSEALKEKKQVAQEPKSDKQSSAKTDSKKEKSTAASE